MKNKKFCAIILNRNLPKVTDKLYSNLKNNNKDLDIFVVDSGSEEKKLSKYSTWHANWKDAKKNGLRYLRGMNYALSKLEKEKKLQNYFAYILLANDIEFKNYKIIPKLKRIFDKHPKIGILSPCSKQWGEYKLLNKNSTKYFWYIFNNAFIVTTKFINIIKDKTPPGYINFLFDGKNFRGYGAESELILKAYSNDFCAAITSEIIAEENQNYLLNSYEEIKTDNYDINLKKYVSEGKLWMKRKYGFSNKWSMNMTVKLFYDKFFQYYPELIRFKI